MTSRTPETPGRETLNRLNYAVYPSFAMLAGLQLDVFTPLAKGPMTAKALAEEMNVSADKLAPLLYALVIAGLLEQVGDHFANTQEAGHFLVRGQASYLGNAEETLSFIWSAALTAAESIRTGKPQARIDYLAMPEEDLSAFFRPLHPHTEEAGRDLARRFGFSRFSHLLDVGGGSGGVAIGACRECPELCATVADLPTVAPITRQFVAEAGLTERIQVRPADLVAGAVAGPYDVAVLRFLIQVLSRDHARRVIRHVGQSLAPGGMIVIVGQVLDDTRLSPWAVAASNFTFSTIYEAGEAYTEEEHRAWLAEAGFIDVERELLPTDSSIMTAKKAPDPE